MLKKCYEEGYRTSVRFGICRSYVLSGAPLLFDLVCLINPVYVLRCPHIFTSPPWNAAMGSFVSRIRCRGLHKIQGASVSLEWNTAFLSGVVGVLHREASSRIYLHSVRFYMVWSLSWILIDGRRLCPKREVIVRCRLLRASYHLTTLGVIHVIKDLDSWIHSWS